MTLDQDQARQDLLQASKPGTRQLALITALIKAGDKGATFKSLSRKVYGKSDEERDDSHRLINVLRGIRLLIEKLDLPIQVKREGGRLKLEDLKTSPVEVHDESRTLTGLPVGDGLSDGQGFSDDHPGWNRPAHVHERTVA